jgi:hypothetical protein
MKNIMSTEQGIAPAAQGRSAVAASRQHMSLVDCSLLLQQQQQQQQQQVTNLKRNCCTSSACGDDESAELPLQKQSQSKQLI